MRRASVEAHLVDSVLQSLHWRAWLATNAGPEPFDPLHGGREVKLRCGQFLERSAGHMGVEGVESIGHGCEHLDLSEPACGKKKKKKK